MECQYRPMYAYGQGYYCPPTPSIENDRGIIKNKIANAVLPDEQKSGCFRGLPFWSKKVAVLGLPFWSKKVAVLGLSFWSKKGAVLGLPIWSKAEAVLVLPFWSKKSDCFRAALLVQKKWPF